MKQLDKNLFIGDANDTGNTKRRRENDIEYILNVSRTTSKRQVKNYIHVPLSDDGDNTDFMIETAIKTAQRLQNKAKAEDAAVMIHCATGVSRSVAIASSLMSLGNGVRVRENLNRVKKIHPAANPHPELLKDVSRITADIYN
jgi:Dual specificity phosphatase, catalytic domain.